MESLDLLQQAAQSIGTAQTTDDSTTAPEEAAPATTGAVPAATTEDNRPSKKTRSSRPDKPRASRIMNCNHCRAKKLRCDRNNPCSNCALRKLECQWENGPPPVSVRPEQLKDSTAKISQLRREVLMLSSKLDLTKEELEGYAAEADAQVLSMKGLNVEDPNYRLPPLILNVDATGNDQEDQLADQDVYALPDTTDFRALLDGKNKKEDAEPAADLNGTSGTAAVPAPAVTMPSHRNWFEEGGTEDV